MSSPTPSATYGVVLDNKISKRGALRFNLTIALLVWALWLAFGGRTAIYHLFADWKVALTMVFGSLVGGGTSEGGGEIAFPISCCLGSRPSVIGVGLSSLSHRVTAANPKYRDFVLSTPIRAVIYP